MIRNYYILFSTIVLFILIAVGVLIRRAHLTDAFFEYQRSQDRETFNTQQ